MAGTCILIVEDSASLALTYQGYLETAAYCSDVATTAAEAIAALQQKSFSAILLDLHLPDGDGIDLLKAIRKSGIDTPVIVMTADPSIDHAVNAVRAGAEDFISKPVAPERLLLTLKNILVRQSLKSIVNTYRTLERDGLCDFIGKSPAMQATYRILENAAGSKASVFVTGESGTGKELAARAIHTLGKRKDRVFEALNCAAIPATLIESEMFGHVKGAFTGATMSMTGAAARAHQGTLFLDELTEMPLELQSKLLRFTQTGGFRPLGGQQEISVDVRFVSATNRDPLVAVKEGKLREDLYYRLNVIPVHLPPLRERGEDVVMIAEAFIRRIAAEEKKNFQGMHEDVKDYLLAQSWPGNVRELENIMRRIIVLHDGDMLTMDMVSDSVRGSAPPKLLQDSKAITPLHEIERLAIEHAIQRCGGNILQAARELEVNPSTIHRKLRRWHGQP